MKTKNRSKGCILRNLHCVVFHDLNLFYYFIFFSSFQHLHKTMMKGWVFPVIAIILVAMLSITGDCQEGGKTIKFSKYTAELYTSEAQGHGQHSRRVVFDDKHAYKEGAYLNDASFSYMYHNGGDHFGKCERVGDHHNCYVLSAGFKICEDVEREREGFLFVDCPVIKDPILGGSKRKLEKCYFYKEPSLDIEGNLYITDKWIELGTHYPVRFLKNQVGSTKYEITDFCSFEETVPNDRTKLSPIPGVKVYDFRDGKEGLFTESESLVLKNTQNQDNNYTILKKTIVKHFGFVGPSMGPAPVHMMSTRDTIPESFDAREQWPKCSVIKEIKNQNPCGSCWAMASSSVLADRMCISTNGATDVSLSPQFMVNCFPNQCGCQGGSDEPTWKDLMDIGTVPESCLPFHKQDETCTGRCDDGTQMPKYTKAKNFYSPWGETDKARVEAIQREIMEHGSVAASFIVFTDWEPYWLGPTSVYHRSKTATYDGGHVVRIIGWGTENGEDYWLIANSWGTGSQEGGFFKMRRGINECNIEETVIAGEPLIE